MQLHPQRVQRIDVSIEIPLSAMPAKVSEWNSFVADQLTSAGEVIRNQVRPRLLRNGS